MRTRLLVVSCVMAGLVTGAMAQCTAPAAPAPDAKTAKDAKAPPYKGPKKRIAVMDMDTPGVSQSACDEFANIYKSQNEIHTPSDVGQRLTEMLTTALDNTGRFVLLERAAIGDIKNEIAVTADLGNKQTQVKKGNLLGAQMLVRGAVTEFEPHRKHGGGGISFGPVSVGGGGNQATVTIDIRFVDPNTSQILFTAKAEGSSTSQGGGAAFAIGSLGVHGEGGSNQPIEKATRDAIEKAVKIVVDKMGPLPWEAKVASIEDDGTILLNRGSNDGLQVGDILEVFKPGKTVTDPDSGEILGRSQDTKIGEAQITWVGDRLAKASFSGTGKTDTGYILKIPPKPGN